MANRSSNFAVQKRNKPIKNFIIMKKINEQNLAYVQGYQAHSGREWINEDWTYTLFIDLKENSINVGHGGNLSKTQVLIGKVKVGDSVKATGKYKVGTKAYDEAVCTVFGRKCNELIKEYREVWHTTKSGAIAEFGKKFVESQEPIATFPNPHYHCSGDMCIYNLQVLAFNKKLWDAQQQKAKEMKKRN